MSTQNEKQMKNIEMSEFKTFESVKFWMDGIANRKESTKVSYLRNMRRFCEAISFNPDQLYEMRKQDLKSEDERAKYRMENLLKRYIADLDKQGKGIGTLKNHYAAVRSFFEYNRVKLDLRRADAPSGEGIGKEPAEKIQIRHMIDVAEPFRFRCLISFLKDIGWRLSDVLALKWGDVNDMGEGFWNFKKVTKKETVVANGFVGPETTHLMQLYRVKREKAGETISDDSPLFKSEKGKHYKSLPHVSQKIGNMARLVNAKNVSAHSLRKYFKNTLETPELHIQKTWIKQMMGKKLNPGDKPYVEHRTEKLLKAYKRAYEKLRLIEIVKPEEEKALEAMKELYAKITGKDPAKLLITVERLKRWRRLEFKEQMKLFSEEIEKEKRKTATNGGSMDCQQIVSEGELSTLLAEGWRVAAVLPSGKVVVES
jgi:integrase